MKQGEGHSLIVPAAAQVLYCEIDGMEVEMTPRDFSAAGFFVRTISVPSADTEVEIFLRSGIGSITVRAVVVRVVTLEEAAAAKSSPGFGALFMELSDDDRVFLTRTTDEVKRSLQPAPPPPAAVSKAPDPPADGLTIDPEPQRGMAKPIRVTRDSLQPRKNKAGGDSSQGATVLAEVKALLERDGHRTAWRVLGVGPDASVKEAKRAFLGLAKRHHPHVYARHKDPNINEVATRLFILHKKAYSDFCKEAARKAPKEGMSIPKASTKEAARTTPKDGMRIPAAPTKTDPDSPTQHTARLWNERRGKADG